jgi:Trk-type K+ transport system membrane component
MFKTEACIPINDLFTGPLSAPFNLLVGGVGGITIKVIVVAVLIFLLVKSLFSIMRSRDAKQDIAAMPIVLFAIAATILIIMLVNTVFNALNNAC